MISDICRTMNFEAFSHETISLLWSTDSRIIHK